jgi:hypothetical protein
MRKNTQHSRGAFHDLRTGEHFDIIPCQTNALFTRTPDLAYMGAYDRKHHMQIFSLIPLFLGDLEHFEILRYFLVVGDPCTEKCK